MPVLGIARPSREFLEFAGLSLLLAAVWLLVSNKRQAVKTVVALYLLGLLVAYNPPLQPLVWLMWNLGDGYALAIYLIWITLGLEAQIFLVTLPRTWPWLRRQLPKLGQVPLLVWALWGGFALWLWKPAVVLGCQGASFETDLVAPLAQQWPLKPQTIPGVEQLPAISFISKVEGDSAPTQSCHRKRAHDFAGAYRQFSLTLIFRGEDSQVYTARTTVRSEGQLQFASWQVEKDKAARPLSTRGALTGQIQQMLERFYRAEPKLRDSACVAFSPLKDDPKRFAVVDISADGKLIGFYRMRLGAGQPQVEHFWNTEAVRASLRRITQRLGVDFVDWTTEAMKSPPLSCLPGKPYFGLQIRSDKFIAYLPPVQIKSSMLQNEIIVALTQGAGAKHQLGAREISADYSVYTIKHFRFTPEPDDFWTSVFVSGPTPFTLSTQPDQVTIRELKR